MKKNTKIILASTSPRRKKILEEMGLEFEIIPSQYEEILESDEFSYEKIENLAYQKAKSVFDKNAPLFTLNPSPILSADTVVVLGNKILGKPKDEEEACDMLKSLSGKKHFVVTSICLLTQDDKKICSTTSYVEFNNLSEEQINYYVKKFNPLDKAGAYGIQELPDGFVKNVEGSFENIIGLCPLSVQKILDKN